MSLDSDVPGRADAVVTSSVGSLRLIRTRGPEKAGSATTVRPATPKRKNSLAVGPSSYSLPPQASGLVTMKRMVALASPTLNESNVEPSSCAWLRTRAPVPTTYAPACESLYPFQEILENRTSRARGMTDNCAEVPSRKCLICIEMWQVELESCVWRVSFHKYAYVHGDPVNAIDPTGMFWQSLYLRVKDAAASLGAKYAIEATLKEIGKRYAWKLAQNFVEWYYIDNHINGTIDALAGFAYEVSGMQDKNVAAVVGRLNAILGTLTAMRRVMKTSPLLLVPLLSANPSFKGSKLEGLVNF